MGQVCANGAAVNASGANNVTSPGVPGGTSAIEGLATRRGGTNTAPLPPVPLAFGICAHSRQVGFSPSPSLVLSRFVATSRTIRFTTTLAAPVCF